MSYKILVIDHDPDSFEEMMRPLINAGYEVVVATDADQGLDAFDRMQPDLTMIEAFLPQRTGPQLCRQLRQTESGRSAPIVLIHDIDRGEDARKSLDGCDCDQIIDRPVSDQQLLDLCKRLLPMEKVARASGPDTFLNTEQLDDALDRLNLIIDGEADKLVQETALGTAGVASASPQAPVVTKASPPPSATPPPAAGLPESMASDELGDDISAHIDTLFGGGPTSAAASDVEEAAPAAGSLAGDQPVSSEAAAQSLVMDDVPRDAEAPPEPRVETKPAPASAASRPAPSRVAQPQTEAIVPPRISKTAPATAKFAVPRADSAGRSKLWFVAASIAVVILGGAFALFFMRGSSPDPMVAIPNTPALDGSGSETIASAGLAAREAAPSLPVPLPQQADATVPKNSLVDTGESPPAGSAEPKLDQPPRTQTSPKPQTAPAKAAKPDPPKPAPVKVAAAQTTRRSEPQPRTPAPKPAEAAVQAAAEPVTESATTTRAVNSVAGNAEKTTSPPTPSPERVEPVTETVRLTPRSEPTPQPAVTPPHLQPTAPLSTADTTFRPPVVVSRVEPVYSRKAQKKNEKGTIVINVLVSVTGNIASVVIDKGIPGSEIEAAAMNAVLRWKFEPATEGGKPVKAWTKAQFVFD
ncbi:MAG: TonB family protein [Planctomycetota bacterium]|nr:TonB family protein [Planctomycetota bacterium]